MHWYIYLGSFAFYLCIVQYCIAQKRVLVVNNLCVRIIYFLKFSGVNKMADSKNWFTPTHTLIRNNGPRPC